MGVHSGQSKKLVNSIGQLRQGFSFDSNNVFTLYFFLRIAQYAIERVLLLKNYKFSRHKERLEEAQRLLGITQDDITKSLAYSEDRFKLASISNAASLFLTLIFLQNKGLGLVEKWAKDLVFPIGGGEISVGLVFFAFLAILSMMISLPFDYYSVFYIEEKHGFNRQKIGQFMADRIKGIGIGAVLGAAILSAILWIMKTVGAWWWVIAWITLSGFSILAAWLYPTFLAPLFNKFTMLEPGELKDKIDQLALKTGFAAEGVYLMDASKRSGHGNAYFTGIFGKKRIVLFDTLVQSLTAEEVVAVLAHELGHFKLKHVLWSLLLGLVQTGLLFYLLSLCLPLEHFYTSFGLSSRSDYGALIVFGLCFSFVEFILQPMGNYLSRRNEFAADRFAVSQLGGHSNLASALLKLRGQSHSMPISHPLYSQFYHTHPPLIERLRTMGYAKEIA